MTTAERLRDFWGERNIEGDRVTLFAARYWQVLLIVAVIGLGAGLRLWDLGNRAIHHDESIHINFAYNIEKHGIDEYTHDPTYHGPFQYVAIATGFKFFGASDYTSRLAPAIFGIALVALPFLLRRRLGKFGTFLSAGLIAVSPVILYVSRFAREDMYVVFFTMAMAVCVWRYLDEPREEEDTSFPATGEEFHDQAASFWPYVTQPRNLWLIPIAPLMALSFATKEITPITVAIFLIFLNFLAAWALLEQFRATRRLSPLEIAVVFAAFAATAWALVAVWPLFQRQRERFSLTHLPPAGALLLIFGTMAVPQFSAAIQEVPKYVDKIPAIGGSLVSGFRLDALGDAGYMHEPTVMHITVLFLIFASAAVGLLWNWRVWLVAALLFYIPFVVLFTSFFTHGAGFWTGSWGSVDYWLEQQGVRRGNQPDYYYFILTPVYEFLPLVFAIGGTLYYAFKGRLEQKLLSGSALLLIFVLSILPKDTPLIGSFHYQIAFLVAIGAVLLLQIDTFTKFLIYWALAILFALTLAGEKMPWLTVHLALPLALLGGKFVGGILESFAAGQASKPEETSAEQAPAAPPATNGPLTSGWLLLGLTALLALVAALIFQAAGPASGLSLVAWAASAGAAVCVILAAQRASPQAAAQIAGIGLFAALLVFTVRAAGFAAYDQGDLDGYPQELLIYAQGSPKLGVIAHEIDRFAEESHQGYDLPIVIDNTGNIWPWPWYMREYAAHNSVTYTNYDDFTPPEGAVLLVNQQNQAKVAPFLDDYQDPIPYAHMWWFPEFYRGLNTTDFLGDVVSGRYFDTWRAYFIDRTVPGANPGADMFAYFPKSFSTDVPVTAVPGIATGEPLPPESVELVGGAGLGEGEFSQPAGVTVDAEGNVYVVDTLNQRIQKLAPDGTWTTFGAAGNGPGQFADPFTPDDYENHDGPWGVTVDADGNIYVADTWNHRIQRFDADFQFTLDWGGGGDLFGPRDIAIAPDGSVYVVDTGHKQIVKYDAEGGLSARYGAEGSDPSQFNEPSSISIAPNGDIYVADYWNQRIQRFNAAFQFLDEITVPSWGSHGITDRAYLVVLSDGHILATDPANGRVAVFNAAGEEQGSWRTSTGPTRPVGIAVDADEQYAYITDGALSTVVRVPVSALLASPSTSDTPAAP